MLNVEQRVLIDAALRRYGARLTEDDHIAKDQKVMSVRLEVQKGRLRMIGGNNVLATYPASRLDAGVSDFVKNFWFWKPVG